jgi:hypothetical protein
LIEKLEQAVLVRCLTSESEDSLKSRESQSQVSRGSRSPGKLLLFGLFMCAVPAAIVFVISRELRRLETRELGGEQVARMRRIALRHDLREPRAFS